MHCWLLEQYAIIIVVPRWVTKNKIASRTDCLTDKVFCFVLFFFFFLPFLFFFLV